MFISTLAISCLISLTYLAWFVDRIFQVPMQYCFFTVLEFTFITRHIHKWVSFPLWPSHFILSRSISNCPLLFPSSILGTFWHREFILQCRIFLPFPTVHWILTARILSGMPFSPPIDHVLSEFSTMIHLFWVVLNPWVIASLSYTSPFVTTCDPWRGVKHLEKTNTSSTLSIEKLNVF